MTHGSEHRTTAGAPAGASSARQRRRCTTVLAALGAVVVLVVALALVRDHVFSSPSPVLLPSHPPRAQGYTGEGVIIAVIDGRIDTSIPELERRGGHRVEHPDLRR